MFLKLRTNTHSNSSKNGLRAKYASNIYRLSNEVAQIAASNYPLHPAPGMN